MIVRGVDPRDIQWEDEQPDYRLYFWHQPTARAGVAQSHLMFRSMWSTAKATGWG